MARSLVRDSTIYGLGTLLGRAVGLVLIPVYTRYLDVAEYGALALLNLIMQNVSFVCLLGVSTAAMRAYFEPGASDAQRQAVYGTASTLVMVFPPVVLLVLMPLAWFLVDRYLPSVSFYPLVLLTLLAGLFTPVAKLLLGLLRVRRQATWFISFNLGLLALQAVATVVALAGFGLALKGQVYAQLFANAVFAAIAFMLLARYARPRLDWTVGRGLLAFGLPLVPFFLFIWVYESAGRFMLEHYASLVEVGKFALAAQFAGLVAMAGGALENVLLPHFLEHAGRPDGGRQLGRVVQKYLTWLGILGLIVLVVASPAIRLMAHPDYFIAERHVPLLVLAFWLSMARTPVTWSLNCSRRSGALSLLNAGAVVVLVTFLYATLARLQLGIDGVAIAMMGANLLVVAVGYAVAQQSFRLSIPFGRLVLGIAVLLTAGVAIVWVGSAGLSVRTVVAQSAVLVAASLLAMRLAGLSNPLRALWPRQTP